MSYKDFLLKRRGGDEPGSNFHEGEKMNLLLARRKSVQVLEEAFTRAKEKKERCDLALKQRLDEIERTKPKLPEGVVQQFEINPSNRRPWVSKESQVVQTRSGPVLVVNDPPGEAERQAARVAQIEYAQASTELQTARQNLSALERELTELKLKIECFGDLNGGNT